VKNLAFTGAYEKMPPVGRASVPAPWEAARDGRPTMINRLRRRF